MTKNNQIEWVLSDNPVAYEEAIQTMDERAASVYEGDAQELVWFLEHPPLYTAGTSAKDNDLLDARFPVFKAGRGGEYTYHGPGQRVAYVMLNLRERQDKPDVKCYVHNLEEWIIRSLAAFDIIGERREGRVGIWVVTPQGEKKVAAIGVRIRRWVTMHGIAINVNPDLSHFGGIVPCGISDAGVTSMAELLGRDVMISELDGVLKDKWVEVFEGDQSAAKSVSCA